MAEPLQLRTSAYVFFEDPGSASWSARLAAAELPMALLWGASLLGFLTAILVAPTLSLLAAGAIVATEALLFVAVVFLSAAWLRGHRTPALDEDALLLQGPLDEHNIPYSSIERLELTPLGATEPPRSRVSVVSRDGAHVHLDMAKEDALSLCRLLQQRLFGGAATGPHDDAVKSLDREQATVAEWTSRLRERFAKTGYRHAAGIAQEDLDRVLHDAALPAPRRLGAAIALCAAGGPEGRQHLLRVAEHIETRALRIAVTRTAEGSLDEEALASAEAEDAAVGRAATPPPR